MSSLQTTLRRWQRAKGRSHVGGRSSLARRIRLQVERLEDRIVLAGEIDVRGGSLLGSSIPDGTLGVPPPGNFRDFGATAINGGSVAKTFYVQNTSFSSTLTLTGSPDAVAISGPNAGDFTVTTNPSDLSLSAFEYTSFTITFDPSAAGTRTATVTIPNSDSNENPYDFLIQGTGGGPDIDVLVGDTSIPDGNGISLPTDATTGFGVADLSGDVVVKTFTIKNTGDGYLNLTGSPSVTITPYQLLPGVDLPGAGDFTVTMLPDLATLDPEGGTTTFQVTYDPSPLPGGLNPDLNSTEYNSGPALDSLRYAKINIASNDSNENPYDFVISGGAIVGTVRATLVDGVLTIDDIHPTGKNNGFVVSEVGSDLVISDAVSLETFTPDSATNTGGALSLANKVLTIPRAGINSIVINGNGGNDSFNAGLLTIVGRLALNGGDGDDTFGSSIVGLSPWPLTRVTIDGGNNGATGDKIYVDLSIVVNLLGPVVLGTSATNGITAVSTFPYRPLEFTQVESAALRDNNQPTSYGLGDFYARGSDYAGDRFEVRSTTTANVGKFYLSGVAGSNYLIPGKVIFYGRGGADRLSSTYVGHAVEFYGEGGNDTLIGSNGADKLVGGPGSDDLSGGEGNNVLWGDNDPVAVGLADTAANREALADNVPGVIPAGLSEAPHPVGLAYNDKIRSGNGADEIYCGPGDDGTSRAPILAGGGNDYVSGGDGNDRLDLGTGNDRGYGGAGNDYLYGRDGSDFLAGNDGNDYLYGGNQNDVLVGGLGTDTVNGERGSDRAYQGNLSVTVNVATLPLLPPVASVPYTGTDRSLRKGDVHDQAMAELLADWADGALGVGLTLASDLAVIVG